MQGWRVEMEDAHLVDLNCVHFPHISVFGVFDGHGGMTVSKESALRLVPAVVEHLKSVETGDDVTRFTTALKKGLLSMDQDLRKLPRLSTGEDRSGSTANIAIVTPEHIFTANCGDSRSVFSRKGQVFHSTVDHKPADKSEVDRIKAAGGFIEMGRVCGNLAVSRALGDFYYKDRSDLDDEAQKICAAADVTHIPRHPEDEFLLLACDGIWDVMTNEDAIEFVHDQLKASVPHERIAENMLDYCLQRGSKDNMSVILVLFENAPKPVAEYQSKFQIGNSGSGANGTILLPMQ